MERNFFEKLTAYVEQKNYRDLRECLAQANEVDVADFLEQISDDDTRLIVFRMLPKELAAEVFSYLPSEIQQQIINAMTDHELSYIIEELYVDDAVDLLEELPANVVKRVLKNATPERRKLINQLLRYPDNSAGSVMTAEFVDVRKDMSVREALEHLRRTGNNKESIYICYVIDQNRHLDGAVELQDLLFSNDDKKIEEIMDTDIVSVKTSDDRETVGQLFSKYDLLSMPVVDQEKRLVGIVTIDDAVEVIEEEATEDFEKMAAMLPSEKPYLKTSVFVLAKNRIVWLLILMVSGMVTGSILERYEAAFATVPLLVTFIPMLTDTGGNAGSQSSTLIIRGMALSEIKIRDWFQVLFKEFRVSLLVGVILSAVNYIRLIITYPGQEMMALTVAFSLLITVIFAKVIGGLLPMLAKLIHADPAIMAAPLITTIVDALSLIVYFNIAQHLMGL